MSLVRSGRENYPRKLHTLSSTPKQSFSREKDHTITMRQTKLKVIPEIAELRNIRKAYTKFTEIFSEFIVQNPPQITTNELSAAFSDFKVNFETFLTNCSLFFKTAESTRRVGRFSPLIEFSQKMLNYWTTIVSKMNEFADVKMLPHVAKFKADFSCLNTNVQQISDSIVTKTYYKESVASQAKVVKFNINQLSTAVNKVMKNEPEKGFPPQALAELKYRTNQLCKLINDKYIILLPSNVTSTPELIRLRSLLQSAGGDILALLDSAYNFRALVSHSLNRMKRLDNEIRQMLDATGIKYTINIVPNGDDTPSEAEEEEEAAPIHENDLHNTEEMFSIQIPETKIPEISPRMVPRSTLHSSKSMRGGTVKFASQTQNIATARSVMTPRKPLISVPNEKLLAFLTEMESTLGISVDENSTYTDRLTAIEKTVKEKLGKPDSPIENNNTNNVEDPNNNENNKEEKE
ncbi:hypothetical protein TVAG_043080 [Trichomonas vaginalis G3]|uniref:Uncharacterized protein n=1 Tax=Trichomonas vaginalis (strain ATCC PRA-98 / G3) TaxID=412133 RepID=A2F6S2_TRIV3|nr:hypothetical protein TVAGG3_0701520 [Trichomonas vaginalis G3]EAX99400.1 hypothetical protein TVAG_043080 [Trichomonas vaginalis G3]KAI5509273.1 hypothetical protein TVAGG3_0701520 [Trichomonas vaginalis G3]|eukprot:XP_001312330.1 hypothetical protein [Trichomonas vaginalis G3]